MALGQLELRLEYLFEDTGHDQSQCVRGRAMNGMGVGTQHSPAPISSSRNSLTEFPGMALLCAG